MDHDTKQKLLLKNEKLINMVVERTKRDFPEDIAASGLIGSFTTNEYHEKSDLDLIILINNEKGWGISRGFILDDVGYDFYCTSWDRIPTMTHMEVYYCAKPEYQARINDLLETKQKELDEPVGNKQIEKAKRFVNSAKQCFANVMIADKIGAARYYAGEMLDSIIEAISELNNKVIRKYGLRKFLETLLSFEYLPNDFEEHYMLLVDAKDIDGIKQACVNLLTGFVGLYDEMSLKFIQSPVPTYDNLKGTYEELWCNYRNKILRSTSLNEKSYAFLTAIGAQNYLNEMTFSIGTKRFDVMQYFDSDNLSLLRDEFLKIMDEYLSEYEKAGRMVEKYETFDELYAAFMSI